MNDDDVRSETIIPCRFSAGDLLKMVVPPLLAVVLFIVACFGIILPAAEKNLLDQKKRSIALLTQTAWNILAYHEQQIWSGAMSLHEAQESATRQIRFLRYGPEGKDYFWINDLGPRMIMHPYRPDLDGKDIAGFADPSGKRLFVEFAGTARRNGEGFVPYLWQWKDDPERIAPKLSHVRLFAPWG